MQQLFSDQAQEKTVPASQLGILGEMGEKSIIAVFLLFSARLPGNMELSVYQSNHASVPVTMILLLAILTGDQIKNIFFNC